MNPMIALAFLSFTSPQEVEKVAAIVAKGVAAHGGADKLLRTFSGKERCYFGTGEKGTLHLWTEFLELERLKEPPGR